MENFTHTNLSHLSPSEIEDVIKLYKEGEKVSVIAELYNIELLHGSLVPLLPPKVERELCPYCGVNMLKTVSRKNSYTYCPECSHKPIKHCTCNNCIKTKQNIRKRVRDAVLELESEPPNKPDSLLHWLYQQTLQQGHIGNGVLKPLERLNVKLTPGNILLNDINIAQTLYSHGIITVSDKSPLSAFPDKDDIPSFYTNKVFFKTDVSALPPAYTEEEIDGVRNVIAASEVLEYIEYQIDKVGHIFSYTEDVSTTIYTLLNDFSTSQIFSIVWSSINYATRCYSEGWLKRKDFTSHLLKSCKKYAERALAEGWTVKSFNRCKSLPQSVVSLMLDDLLGCSGFDCKGV